MVPDSSGTILTQSQALLNDLVRSDQYRLRDGEPERLRSLEVDDQLEFVGLLYGEIGGLGPFEDFVNTLRASARSLVISEKARSKSAEPRASTS
jgi:hypothetical protein